MRERIWESVCVYVCMCVGVCGVCEKKLCRHHSLAVGLNERENMGERVCVCVYVCVVCVKRSVVGTTRWL